MSESNAVVAIDTLNRTWIGGRLLSPAEAAEYWRNRAERTPEPDDVACGLSDEETQR